MSADDSNYDVPISSTIKQLLRLLQSQAWSGDRGRDFLAAFESITQQLRFTPLDFGEELYNLPSLGLVVKTAVVAPLAIIFSVNSERRVVFIQNVHYMPGA